LNVPPSDPVNLHLSEVRDQVALDNLFVADARAWFSIREELLEERALHVLLEGQGRSRRVYLLHLQPCPQLLQAAVGLALADFIFVAQVP
jgi:hypothetical protein